MFTRLLFIPYPMFYRLTFMRSTDVGLLQKIESYQKMTSRQKGDFLTTEATEITEN